ncbi:MAG: hypothetical protein JJU28_05460 [Cyclobacteriaceae bacterium]|nr:hypothetical protein [Cyclobacteriaceae bacterium]
MSNTYTCFSFLGGMRFHILCLLILGKLVSLQGLHAQASRLMTIPDDGVFEKISLNLTSSNGDCFIESSPHKSLVSVFDLNGRKKIDPYYQLISDGITQKIDLFMRSESLSGGISSRFFIDNPNHKYQWGITLTQDRPLDITMNYVYGDSRVDLSDLSIERLHVNSGNARVAIGYFLGLPNKIQMDTFKVKVDLGTLQMYKPELSCATNIVADVGFGKMYMNFGNQLTQSSHIKASVGAGLLEIFLPKDDLPVIIYLKNSPLCKVKLMENFTEIEKNTFVNASYHNQLDHYLTFDLDVGLGNIIFVNDSP